MGRPLYYKVRRAFQNPRAIWPKVWRAIRNRTYKRSSRDHLSFYRKVVNNDVRSGRGGAITAPTEPSWLQVGQLQFSYLLKHGLRPEHRLLDLGCGNLRAGHLLIAYLEPGNYVGVDISESALVEALRVVEHFGLGECLPYLYLIGDTEFGFLPDHHFDVIQAHSVFSHSPLDVLKETLIHVARIMKADGFFDFTFLSAEGKADRAYDVIGEDYYFPPECCSQHATKQASTPR